jgi:hypothetical protein
LNYNRHGLFQKAGFRLISTGTRSAFSRFAEPLQVDPVVSRDAWNLGGEDPTSGIF